MLVSILQVSNFNLEAFPMNFKSLSAVFALTLASATFAHATSISGTIGLGGSGSYDTATGQFTAGALNSQTESNAYVNAADGKKADSLANFTMFNAASFSNFNTQHLSTGATVFSTTENGQTLTFTLTDMISSGSDAAGPGFVGTGILSETGYADTAANFSLNTNAGAGTVVTFNTVAATPEPSSLLLLGTGALGAAGMMRRRFMGKLSA